jgi:hypothetical protein
MMVLKNSLVVKMIELNFYSYLLELIPFTEYSAIIFTLFTRLPHFLFIERTFFYYNF